MANAYIPRPDARFHARRNNFVTYVNGHPADLGPAPSAMGAEIRVEVGEPPPTSPSPRWSPQKTQS